MYFVKYGDQYLHDPRTDDCILFDLSLDGEQNTCGYCDFTIYPNHPMYEKLKERDTENSVDVYDDKELLFSGYIYELGYEFKLDGHVKCKGDLSYLNDSIVRPYSTLERSFGSQAPTMVNEYFEWLINQHNDQVDEYKKFTIGINQGASLDENNYIYRQSDQYPTTIEEIEEKLLNELGGYIRTRKVDGIRYIDYISEWTQANTQILDFGVNLMDYVQTDDSDGLATFIIPLGASMSETEYSYDDGYRLTKDTVKDPEKDYYKHNYTSPGKIASFSTGVTYYEQYASYERTTDTSPVSGITYYIKDGENFTSVDISRFTKGVTYYECVVQYKQTTDHSPSDDKTYYTLDTAYSSVGSIGKFLKYEVYYEYNENYDESSNALTIVGVEDGLYSSNGYIKSGDMIYHEASVEKYGFIGVKYSFDDITTKENLIYKGIIGLAELISPLRTIEIKAVDMRFVNPEIKPIRIGDYIRVRSAPHKFDSYMLCTKIELNLNNPENSVYTLGTTFDTLTGEQNKKIKELNDTINKQYESATTISAAANKAATVASTSAVQAVNTANTVKTIAITAENTANNAAETASTASETANTASTVATEAKAEAVASGKTATNYMNFSNADGLVVGDMTKSSLGKNVRIASSSVDIRDGSDILASFSASGVSFAKKASFTADGVLINNGDAYCNLGQNQVLWSHVNGYYMNDSQSVNLSSKISRQLSGVIFVWAYYNGSGTNQEMTYFFVPKQHVITNSGAGVRMSNPYLGMNKYLYVSNDGVSGHTNNDKTGTENGIAYNNRNYTLRYIIGV